MIEIVVRVLLAGALGSAALAKLASPRSSRAALGTFGLGAGLLRDLAWGGLIVAELGLAVGVGLGSDEAAYAAAALMGLFALLLVGAILQGRAGAPCACFGSRSKVGWLAVGRNAALAAGFAVVPALPSGDATTDQWLALGIAVALLGCAGLGVAVLALAREVGMLRLQLGPQSALEVAGEGPPVGEPLELMAAIPAGPEATLALAVFVSDGCHVCHSLRPSIEALSRDPVVAVRVLEEDRDPEAWAAARSPGAPYAVAADPDGMVLAKGTFNNLAQLESVLATAERRRLELAAVPHA